ncbi:hypothetical protein TNCV_209851 [Trichonephila clavipes]|uniref:Uncharacterized protein n=1 Tax=Trichonephila clavipes TaxID=2585209 RepID=A0A8X6SZ84_TRICX|nr:hypothetical protein TNCV_209851 [Trichonephila clavipes]
MDFTEMNSGGSGESYWGLLVDKIPVFGLLGLGLHASCSESESAKNALNEVLDESRSFFRVHTGYFSNIPKCIKAEFIASWACSQSSVVSSSQR